MVRVSNLASLMKEMIWWADMPEKSGIAPGSTSCSLPIKQHLIISQSAHKIFDKQTGGVGGLVKGITTSMVAYMGYIGSGVL